MLKTNSKKARENVRAYVLENVTVENYDLPDPGTFEEAAAIIMDTFRFQRWNSIEDFRYYKTEKNSFIEWCQGLPSILDTCYYYNRSAVEDLAAILEETPTEAARYSETEAAAMLTSLIYRELLKGVKEK